MVTEIALLIKGLDTAFNLVQASLKKKKQVEQMGAEISGFFAQKEAVENKIAEVKKHDKNAYIGSPLEEAIQIQNQEDRIADMMKEIGREYSRQGKTPQWQRVQKNAGKIQKERDFNIVQANRRKIQQDRKDADFYLALKLIVGLVILMVGLTGLVYTLAIN
jgi:predicted  nucleic acid-binding Zn-ribbon protein